MELTKITGLTVVAEYPKIQNRNVDEVTLALQALNEKHQGSIATVTALSKLLSNTGLSVVNGALCQTYIKED